MKKSLISAAILAALSSTQVNAGGPKYTLEGTLSLTCVGIVADDSNDPTTFVHAELERVGKSPTVFKVKFVENAAEDDDAIACAEADTFLKEEGVGVGDNDDSDDNDELDDDSDDSDELDDDSDDNDELDDDSDDSDELDDESGDNDELDDDSDDNDD